MKPRRPKLLEFFLAGIALAFLVGAVLVFRHAAIDEMHVFGAATVITALAYYILTKPAPKPKKPEWVAEAEHGTVPRYGTRRWARANYHNGVISLEELVSFCATHPERMDDPDR